MERALSAFIHGAARRLLQTVPRFKYLGRILTEGDDDWPAVARNLVKARKSWGRMQGILSREGATKRVWGNFFKAVVQQVILFGAETSVVSPRMERALSAFIHGAARRLTGRQPRRGWDGKWFYPSLEGAMKETGLTDVQTSINRRKNMVAQYIATQPLLDLCKGATQREGALALLSVSRTSSPSMSVPASDADSVSVSLALAFSQYMPVSTHHLSVTRAPSLCVAPSQRSRSGRVAIYCATMFIGWFFQAQNSGYPVTRLCPM